MIFILTGIQFSFGQNFVEEQLQYPRVKEATDSVLVDLTTKLGINNLDINRIEIYIRAFKMEEEIEVYAREKGQVVFTPILNYKFCSSVGNLGPKLRQGDKQIPEGFYHISLFNPESNYFLSLKVDYPNPSDSARSGNKYLGGDIFIHGSCETIGCIPITDAKIMELYVLAMYAKNNGQEQIPIHIFPARMNFANFQHINGLYKDETLSQFWSLMRQSYEFFERNGYPPAVSFSSSGEYRFSDLGR